MLKYLLLLATVVAALTIYVAVEDHHCPNDHKQDREQLTASASKETPDNQTKTGVDNSEGQCPRWYKFFAWPDGVTVWAILFTLLVVAKQTVETAKSTTAGQIAAEAAKDSANALIDSERAWLLIEIDPLTDGGQDIPFIGQGTSETGQPRTRFYSDIKLINGGRSPCWITDARLKFEIVDSLPEVPDFASQQTEEGWVGTPFGTEGKPFRYTWMPSFGGRESDATMTVVYGVVKYRDIFGQDRTTNFGFKVVGGDLKRLTDSYRKYNEYT
jgi:hypothetical protein